MHNSMRGPETITRTLNILDSMMGKPLESPDCMLTERLPPPEFSKKATKLIKHRRFQSQDYQNVYN